MKKEQIVAEIEALQKKAQEYQLELFKIEGALQFAHYIFKQLTEAETKQNSVVEAQ